ncbi:SpaA isopeptide-forming pilin-related protein [Mycoplasma sp. P36-A1]|uniref:SpaA isopeptide-forming pilin-related protein n=1 Tax=Mycoplasma sp. P36-A1 TaxID=3252900 RepID=UPI003C2D04B4
MGRKINSSKKREGKFIGVMLIVFAFLTLTINNIQAKDYDSKYITSVKLLDKDGNESNSHQENANMSVEYTFEIPNEISILQDDTMQVTLPDELIARGNQAFEIFDSAGKEIVAHATFDGNSKVVTLKFTDYFEKNPNFKNGKFEVLVIWLHDDVIVDGDNDIDWNIDGIENDTIHVSPLPLPPVSENLTKWGYRDTYDKTLIHWVVRINANHKTIENATYTDTIGENQILLKDTLKANVAIFDPNNHNHEKILGPIGEITSQSDTGFEYSFGTLTDMVYIKYSTKTTDGGSSKIYENDGVLNSSNDINATINAKTPAIGGDGSGSGTIFGVELTKVDSKDNNILLEGAEFRLEDAHGKVLKEKITTNKDGKIIIDKMELGMYKLIETKAPYGYILDSTAIDFEIKSEQTENIKLTKENTLYKGSVLITKLDSETKETLSGAVFNILDENNKIIKDSLVTDENGIIKVKGLLVGNYKFVETKAPEGYQNDNKIISFKISTKNETTIKLKKYNTKKKTSSVITDDNKDKGVTSVSSTNKELPKTGNYLLPTAFILTLIGITLSIYLKSSTLEKK